MGASFAELETVLALAAVARRLWLELTAREAAPGDMVARPEPARGPVAPPMTERDGPINS